jgi:hypothetical protein
LRPRRLNELDLDAERLAKRFRHVDVETGKFRCRLVEIGEGAIVAGHADPQRATLDDVVEAGIRRLLRVGEDRPQHDERNTGQHPKHHVFSICGIDDILNRCVGFKPDINAVPAGEIKT